MALKLAIVGRPNVGKSTLFNRLAGKKLAIVDDRPGVTRDRRYADGRLGDLELQLIDTAGFEDVADQSLEARMRLQTEHAVDEADVVLFVVDAREGLTPLDRIFAELLRKRDKPVLLAANKAEGRAGEAGAAEAFALGMGEPIALSAEHGDGLSELYEALLVFEAIAQAPEDEADKPVRIAIVGRPNAGKSTLVNRLIGEDRLLTGPEAGITRDAIPVDWEWEGRAVRLVDTAGLRRKARVQEKLEQLSTSDTIRAVTFAEVVILVMDAAQAFETQDLQIADLVEREGRALVFCLAKWDLVEEPQARLADLRDRADRVLPQVRGTPLVALSAETGRGLDRLMPAVFKAHANWSVKVKTRDLNDWLRLMTQRHPPPAVNGHRIKPKYMAQMKNRPPTFVLLANRAEHMPESYRRYLVNGLRESFDLPGVPIRLIVRQGANPYAEDQEGQPSRLTQARGKRAPKPAVDAQAPSKPRKAKPKPPGPKPAHPGRVKPGPRKPALKGPRSRPSPTRGS
ncbi:MAG: ribosome biogenesis GTPase Der [Pseudomonadota bacterium]|nr:ribosome biogenesis GTPase Der [Pseudomonadota bacterium]